MQDSILKLAIIFIKRYIICNNCNNDYFKSKNIY